MVTLSLIILAVLAGIAAASTACGVNMIFTLRASADRSSPAKAAMAYLTGSVLGALSVGSVLGLVAVVLPFEQLSPVPSVILLLATILLGLRELGLVRLRLPQRESQVNFDALAATGIHRRLFGFGFWLGTGFLTYSPYAGLHALALAVVLQGHLFDALAIFAAFGISRALTVIGLGLSARSWTDAAALGDRVAASYRTAHRVTAVGLAVVGIASAVTLVV